MVIKIVCVGAGCGPLTYFNCPDEVSGGRCELEL